ncbi:uncharacterized protein LOC119089369 [Pollicipes pollicipes]|uniref:uncharacterized protein LOC119089369 n=1 Tax=Pollicipes pollicipes TaxID=41117 RepID=UPI001884E3CD|nr:uncharacterized protein LOC119089369 [Pollicipes pollicipes]
MFHMQRQERSVSAYSQALEHREQGDTLRGRLTAEADRILKWKVSAEICRQQQQTQLREAQEQQQAQDERLRQLQEAHSASQGALRQQRQPREAAGG